MLATGALLVALSIGAVPPRATEGAPAGMVRIAGGDARATPDKAATPVKVEAFFLDEVPVTNAAFRAFVKKTPAWSKARAPRLFAEETYLRDLDLDDVDANAPVTFVSWFAARAFCEAQGKRLPSTAEWERAAAGTPVDKILEWYATPTPKRLRAVGATRGAAANDGVRDMHGLVWEWTEDFSASLVTSDGRDQNDGDMLRFCGAAGVGAADASDYASFMRFAFRGSLEGKFALATLGFRCAKDAPP